VIVEEIIMNSRSVSNVRAIIWLTIALTVFAGISLPQGQPSKKDRKQAEKLAGDGDKAYQQRNYRNAIDQYAQSLALVANNPEVHAKKGNAHFLLKEYDQAVTELDTALSQNYPKPLDIYKIRSFARFEKGDYDGALADAQEVLKVEPNNAMFLLKQADIASAKGNDREALVAYQKAVAQDPRGAELYFKIAQIQSKLGDTSGQIAAAEAAIKGNTQHIAEAFYLAADGYLKQKKYQEAEEAYTRAIDRWKTAGEKPQELYIAYRSLSDIYRRGNRFNDAIRVTKQALVDFPNDGYLYTDNSWYYSLADRNQDAVDAALAAIQFSQKTEHLPYTNLCRAYNDTGQYQLAINNCNEALKISPDDGETYFYLARAYDLSKRESEATKYYEKAAKGLEKFTAENADYSDGFYLLGNAYFADGQRDKAIAAYQKCLELSPRFVKARFNLGIMYTLAKNRTAAMEQYNSLLALDEALAAKLKVEIDKL
jgi:tetratricopeptide (TPR) repeat protein